MRGDKNPESRVLPMSKYRNDWGMWFGLILYLYSMGKYKLISRMKVIHLPCMVSMLTDL